jgi:hypothetical protein
MRGFMSIRVDMLDWLDWLDRIPLTRLRRKQKMADRQRVTTFAKLYQMLRKLQSEIEDVMPEFEEQMEMLT